MCDSGCVDVLCETMVDNGKHRTHHGGMGKRTTPNPTSAKREVQIGVRLPQSLVDDLDAYVAARLAAEPGIDFTRSAAVRVLLGKALAAELSR